MREQVQNILLKTSVLFTVVLLAAVCFAASKEKVIYNFTGGADGGDPATALVFDTAGNAYGTTVAGGAGYGTVFELSPLKGGGWKQATLYMFSGGVDGKNPYGGVILDGKGNLYGTTVAGGSGGMCAGDGCGVVFKLTNARGGWTQNVLYNFTGGNDGFGPGGALVFDKAGNLYGTTPDGGKQGHGVVYTLVSKNGQWTQKVIHAFTGGKDGSTGSLGALLIDASGNLFGVTELGGANQAGTAYKVSPASGGKFKFTTIYAFKGTPDAAFPYGGLTADNSGNLYGTTYYGGTDGVGAVFELVLGKKGGYRESVLYSFKAANDVNSTTTTLMFDKTGSLYGTASAGGDAGCGCGGIFKLAKSAGKWKESVLHNFTGSPDGAYAYYGLTADATGALYSSTVQGGNQSQGTVFRLTP